MTVGFAACGGDDAEDATSAATSVAAAATSAADSAASQVDSAVSSATEETTSVAEEATSAAGEATSAAEEATSAAADAGPASGPVAIDGSSTVAPIASAMAEEFGKENPDAKITVGTSGTGGGFEKFCAGETDISDASRPIKDEETAICDAAGIEFLEVQIAQDGLSVVVNPENDWAECLTVDQLKAIWAPDSKVANWNEIDPSFPDEKLVLYGPGTDSGTFDFFTKEINGEEGASRTDYTASEDDNTLVQGAGGDKGALAYFGLSYALENAETVKLIGVDGGSGCVAPSEETVKDGTYAPLSRPLFMYVSKKSAIEKPQVRAFMDFAIDSAPELVPSVDYVALDQAAYDKDKADLAAFEG